MRNVFDFLFLLRAISATTPPTPIKMRSLQSNRAKFSTLNQIFSHVSFDLPDPPTISQSGLDLTITELSCQDLVVEDISLDHKFVSDTSQLLDIDISGLQVSCDFRWEYRWTIFNGRGDGKATLDRASSAGITLDFHSADYDILPPKHVTIPNDKCTSNIQIDNLDFDGDGLGIIAGIINLFENLIKRVVEGELGKLVCEELADLGDDELDNILAMISDEIEVYLQPLPDDFSNPLYQETNILNDISDEKGALVNFQEIETLAGEWIQKALEQLDSLLGSGTSSNNGQNDLGINELIRSSLLDDQGEFSIDPSLISGFFSDENSNNIIFEGHDKLTETTMSLVSIRVQGLDTFKELDLLNVVGNYTVRNLLKMERLTFSIELEATMMASSLSSSFIDASNAKPITEVFTIAFTANDIEIDFTILLALNEMTLGTIQLGSMLHTTNILPCLFSAIDKASFTGLALTVTDLVPPTMTGFLDRGIDQIMSSGATALFNMYEKALIRAMPNFFQLFVKDVINDYIDGVVSLLGKCPDTKPPMSGFVDFRDLFLDPDDALASGGSGDAPYGNVIPWIMDIIDDQLFSADESGQLSVNELMVRPLTKSQSGIEGSLHFNGTLIDLNKRQVTRKIWTSFADNLRLRLSDLHLSGLDSMRVPTEILSPKSSSAHTLENKISIGVTENVSITDNSDSLRASFGFELLVGGENSPLAMNNLMDLELIVPSLDILAMLRATVEVDRLMKFPLKDITNVDCWISTLWSSKNSGIESDAGVAIEYLNMVLDDGMMVNASCISCTNQMLNQFNSVLSFLEDQEWISNIRSRAILIGSQLARGEWVQGMIAKQIDSSSRRCPHLNFENSMPLAQKYQKFETTREMVDGVLYGGMTLVQVIAIVMAQKHTGVDLPPPVDIVVSGADKTELIDLTDLGSILSWGDMVLDEARTYLGGVVESKRGEQVLGITNLLQSLILDDDGLLKIPIIDKGFIAGGVELSLYNVTLVGLDSFAKFEVLKTSGPQAFGNIIRLDKLGVTLRMGLSVEDPNTEQLRRLNTNKLETITVSLIFKDVEIDTSVMLALDRELMRSMKLGSILSIDNISSCLFSTIHAIGIQKLVMTLGNIDEFSIAGFVSAATQQEIDDFTAAVFTNYKPMIIESLPAFTATVVRPLLNNVLQYFMEKAKREGGACREPDESLTGIVDFRDLFLSQSKSVALLGSGLPKYGDLFRVLHSFIDDVISATNDLGQSNINDLIISKLTDNQSNSTGALFFPGKLFGQEFDIALNGLNAVVEIAVSDVRLSSLDSIGAPIRLLQPVEGEASILNNSVSVGVGPDALRVSFKLFVAGEGDDVKISNELELGLSLKNLSVILELLAEIEEQAFFSFPIKDILDFNCWMATMPTPFIDKLGIRIGSPDTGLVLRKIAMAAAEARLDVNCISCSSSVLLDISTYLSSDDGVTDTTDVANRIFDYGTKLLRSQLVQDQFDRMLNEAEMKCPHSANYNANFAGLKFDEMDAIESSEDAYGFLIAIISVVAVCAVVVVLVYVAVNWVSRRRHNRWVGTLTRAQKLQLVREQREETEREKDLNKIMKSLFCSAEVPISLRLLIPIVIFGNIALFLSGHLSLGGTVNLSGTFAGQGFNVEGFFEFSMAKSTIEMWNAGATALAILIVIFSGIWPYAKQLISLAMWVIPPKLLASRKRGKILHWLDVLGKWSMVDVFVLLTTLASFRISIESPDHLAFLPESLYSINMLVRPLWGLYANMLAQLVSQISSHIIIHYHDRTVKAASYALNIERNIPNPSEPETANNPLRKHSFKLDYEAFNQNAALRKWVDFMLMVALVAFTILVIFGCSLPSFGIEVLGLLGIAVESGNQFEEAKSYYSVFGLTKMIMDEARYLGTASDLVGLGTLSSLLIITVFLVPLAQVGSLFVQWFVPITEKHRNWNTFANDVLSAWQYSEVYVLSVLIASWQLGGVSEFMINEYCGALNPIFTTLSYYGIVDESDAQCFRVNASVEAGSWLLVASSILFGMINNFISSASAQKVCDDSVPDDRRLTSGRWLTNKQSTATVNSIIDASSHDEVEDGDYGRSLDRARISPIPPRFTDYYSFAIRRVERDVTSTPRFAGTAEVAVSATIDEDGVPELWDL